MKKLNFIITIMTIAICLLSCSKKEEITIISYNIRNSGANDGINCWENRKDMTINMIQQECQNIICMQEVKADQLEFIYDEIPNYEFLGVGRDDSVKKGEFMAIFYNSDKLELLENGNFWLSETPNIVSRGWDGVCRRMVTWGHFRNIKSGKTFYCFNTHFDHKGEIARHESARLTVSKIKEITGGTKEPIFLTGDFNAEVEDPIFTPIINSMKQARKDAVVTDRKYTYNNFGLGTESQSVIDHIFYLNASPVSFETLDKSYGGGYISDHYPIKAVFEIQ